MSSALRQTKTAPQRGATRQAPARGASRAAVQKTQRQWPKPNWTIINLIVLLSLLIALLLNFERSKQFMQPYINPPIAKIRVLTELSTAKQQAVEKQLMPYGDGLFFSVDIEAVRNALEELPWIVSAEVSRIWPDQVQVVIQEQLPVARWGKDALLSTQGYLFTAMDVEAYRHLPQLSGPKDGQLRVMQQYLTFKIGRASCRERV